MSQDSKDHRRARSWIGSHLVLLVALFVALGIGSAWAAATASKNSVVSKSIKNGQVKTKDLANKAVTNPKIANGAVTGAKVKANSLTGTQIDESTLNSSVIQRRISGTCGSGLAIAVVNADGSVSCVGSGGPPSGAAGGALAGTYPNPTLNVTGGPCENGQALTDVSFLAVLTCATGVYADATNNTAVGQGGLGSNSTGESNSALGQNALGGNTTGSFNVAVGQNALGGNNEGNQNVAVGGASLSENTNGQENIAVGDSTLRKNTEGAQNAALGDSTMEQNTTGSHNTAVGPFALIANTSGSSNTAVGQGALIQNTSGQSNTALGQGAGDNLTTGSDNIDIANSGVAGDSNTIRIGSETQTKAFLAGVSGVTTGGVTSPVLVDANGQLGTTSSSRRFKQDIRPLGYLTRKLMALRPVSFRYRRSFVHGPNPLQFGLIAEQVAKVYPNLVVYGRDGKPSAVAYQELPALLLAQVQRQQRQNNVLRAANRRQGAQISRQQKQIDWLIQQVPRR